jgi:hypothetical protein
MNLKVVYKKTPPPAIPRFKPGSVLDHLTIVSYEGRQINPNRSPGLQHLYTVECECGEKGQWFQTELIRKRVGPYECNTCRVERNLERKEARKKGPLNAGNITPRNVLTRPWK